ncbi:MAG: hypothetical protein HY812_08045 [Planctomycetes bacterium]|nr:hypothetical protein [Planctomycetota bacterium]
MRLIELEGRLLADLLPDSRFVPEFLLPRLFEQHPRLYQELCERSRDPLDALRGSLPLDLGGRRGILSWSCLPEAAAARFSN